MGEAQCDWLVSRKGLDGCRFIAERYSKFMGHGAKSAQSLDCGFRWPNFRKKVRLEISRSLYPGKNGTRRSRERVLIKIISGEFR
jgi:hypothetical protein